MYVMIRMIGKEDICPGDPVVLKYDTQFGKVGAFGMGGNVYGYLCAQAPAGCLDEWSVYARIGDNRIIAKAAVVFDGGLLLYTDSPVLRTDMGFVRVEKEGYGILVAR